jgi:hypothetical protein
MEITMKKTAIENINAIIEGRKVDATEAFVIWTNQTVCGGRIKMAVLDYFLCKHVHVIEEARNVFGKGSEEHVDAVINREVARNTMFNAVCGY